MSVTFEVPAAFVLAEDVPMTAEDLRYGLVRGFLKPADVVALAAHEVGQGSDDDILMALASLFVLDAKSPGRALPAADASEWEPGATRVFIVSLARFKGDRPFRIPRFWVIRTATGSSMLACRASWLVAATARTRPHTGRMSVERFWSIPPSVCSVRSRPVEPPGDGDPS